MTEPHRHSTGITLTGGSLRPCISILLRRAPVETTPQVSAKASGPRSAERRVHASGDYTGCCVTQRNVSHHIHCNLRVRCSELVRGIASAAILLARSGKSVPRRRDRWLCGSSLRAQADGGRRVHRHRIVALAEPGGDDSRGLLADLSGRSLLRALVCQITRSNPLHGGTSTLGGSLGRSRRRRSYGTVDVMVSNCLEAARPLWLGFIPPPPCSPRTLRAGRSILNRDFIPFPVC